MNSKRKSTSLAIIVFFLLVIIITETISSSTPTAVPTENPTYIPTYFETPEITDTYPTVKIPYYCHPFSTKSRSVYARVFHGLTTNVTFVPLKEANIWY
jgi:ABC-type microcin C transport system permease subunit YejE